MSKRLKAGPALLTILWLSLLPTVVHAELSVLFLGDGGPHRPRERFDILEPVLAQRGIALTYTDRLADLNAANLARFDAVVLYANIEKIDPPQEQALLDYVAAGGGFVPLHCASFCFQNSDALIALTGAQFQSHEWGRFREELAKAPHPVTAGYAGFESADETYVHHRHNERDRTVLSYRVDGDHREPWTWVRWHGKGRVFYTAWGHDHQTWGRPGFHNLVERGVRWAAGGDPRAAGDYLADAPFPAPEVTRLPETPAPFEYVDVGAKIPNYVVSETWGAQGEPLSKMQQPLSPEASMRRMVTPAGFHVELFASEPQLGGKPIAMTWDERGRLWLAESLDYPNELQPPGQGRDRICICEDADGDGRADRFTVFAEGLSIPTSLALARGGVIVHNGPETLFLKDVDGDDRADERHVLLAGWGVNDTHGGASNMHYGLDNWIWGMQGYNKSSLAAGGATTTFGQGFLRFRPDGSAIEFLRSTNNNTWGLGVSEEGIVFGSTANGNPSEYMPIPNRYYERVRGWTPQLTLNGIADSDRMRPITDKVRQVDHHGGYTAAAGHALYTAREFPREYWNRTALVCEPTGHLVGVFVLTADGAGFRSTNPFNLLASDDEWTAPTMAEVGPDGAVWVIDWYNYIVQHNPTPQGFETGRGSAYETDLRDKKHARIYRVVYDKAPQAPRRDLSQASPRQWVETLRHSNLFWRRHAQRLLVQRNKPDVVPELLKLIGDSSVDSAGLNVGAIHALWTFHGLGRLGVASPELEAVTSALRHPSAGVRRNALQTLPSDPRSTAAILDARLLQDGEPQVRLQALLTLADQPASGDAGRAVAQFLARPHNAADRWLVDAATSAAAAHAVDYLVAVASARGPTSAAQVQVAQVVGNHLARSGDAAAVSNVIAALGTAEPAVAGATVAGLQAGWQPDAPLQLSSAARTAVAALQERLPLEGKIQLARLALRGEGAEMATYLDELTDELFARIESGELPTADRAAAAELVIAAQPQDIAVARRLLDLVTPLTPPDVGQSLIVALRKCTAEDLGPTVLATTAELSPATREAAFELLLSRPALTAALLDALDQNKVRASELSLVQRQRLSEHPDEALRTRARASLASASANVNADRQQVLAEYAPLAASAGDAAKGKEVFTKTCAVCHRLRGEGASVGPDLSGMAVHGKEQLLVHLLDPNRDVEGNFVTYTALTADGLVLSGMLGGESATSIELVDAQGQRHALLREDVEELTRSDASLMPEGFEKQLSRTEIADLLAYLVDNTKFVPLDIRRAATVTSARGMFNSPDATVERLIFDDWGAKIVDGVPFYPVDPQNGRVRNVVMLYGPYGVTPPTMPRSVELKVGGAARAIHFLSGVSGWGFPTSEPGTVSMIVRLRYADGTQEEHPLNNGVHFADYLGSAEVPESKLAYSLGRQQIRYFKISPARSEPIDAIELVKGDDETAPLVMAVTVEPR